MPEARDLTGLRTDSLAHLDARIGIPSYDRQALGGGIVHIGVGGFHRAHQAEYLDDLCSQGLASWSITGVGILASDAAMAAALHEQDCLYTVISRSTNATDVRVIGSITAYEHSYPEHTTLIDRIADPTTKIVSLTITEGGYPLSLDTGEPTGEKSATFAAIAEGLEIRRVNGTGPISVLSCDNIIHNGRAARSATLAAAEDRDGPLAAWIASEVAFPSTMVDRITPATTETDRVFLQDEYGLNDLWPVVTEPFRQWVIEDTFAVGRPPWEDAGALMTSDVMPYELLKLRILNAGHSVLAYLAALDGQVYVHDVVSDPTFERFLQQFLDREATPSLPSAPGIDIEAYKASVIERFSNPEIQDQIARLCLDGSSKFPTFLIPTIESQLAEGRSIDLSMLALAGWCQYLLGRDDSGDEIELAADPNLDRARLYARSSLQDPASFLDFDFVFPSSIRTSSVARDSFADALRSLRTRGTRASIDERVARA
ncbi:MAG: mannitol dehydrogenase family protein [Acidimicrobiia bacterium]